MGLEMIRWRANERVGLPDQEASSNLLLEEMQRQAEEILLRSADGPKVFGGFALTDLGGGGLARLDYGRAILPVRKDQELSYGFFLGLQAPSSYQIDFSGAADDTYDVYVRAVYTDATFGNRVFWDPSASSEYTDYVATRQVVSWEVAYVADSVASPGSEWVRLWSVDVATGAITGTTDRRPLYFEGAADGGYGFGWGDGANDRNADRAAYGVTDRWTWDQAVRRQIADIIGSPVGAHTFWPATPIELEQLSQEHWPESAGAGIRGKHKDINFGASGRFWKAETVAPGAWAWETLKLVATEEGTATPYLKAELGDSGAGYRLGLLAIEPRGGGPASVTGDEVGIEAWGGNVKEVTTLVGANTYETKWVRHLNEVMRLDYGSGASAPGLHVPADPIYADQGFRLDSAKSVYLPLPWSAIVPDDAGSRSWEMYGPSSGDVAASNVSVRSIGTLSGAKPIFFEFLDFPDGATLTAIDVAWSQTAAGAGNQMRMYAARHRNTMDRPADTHGAGQNVTSGFEWLWQALHSSQNWVEYAVITNPEQVRRFKPDQNNTAWARRKDKLVVSILPPDTTAQTLAIHQILTRWTYQEVGPWGVTEGW